MSPIRYRQLAAYLKTLYSNSLFKNAKSLVKEAITKGCLSQWCMYDKWLQGISPSKIQFNMLKFDFYNF